VVVAEDGAFDLAHFQPFFYNYPAIVFGRQIDRGLKRRCVRRL
jgi:hypothetical protein